MSVKKYGIYLAWHPLVSLSSEGLGRYLINFIRGILDCADNTEVVIVAPSWSKQNLLNLFVEEELCTKRIHIVAPKNMSFILSIFLKNKNKKVRKFKGRRLLPLGVIQSFANIMGNVAANVRDVQSFFVFILALIPFLLITPIVLVVVFMMFLFFFKKIIIMLFSEAFKRFPETKLVNGIRKLKSFIKKRIMNGVLGDRWRAISSGSSPSQWLFSKILEQEEHQLLKLVKKQTNVIGWYCPTVFWKSFNYIPHKVKLICVPDVVYFEFPYRFQVLFGNDTKANVDKIINTINSGKYYVTYSNVVKWNTLVDRFDVPDANISVVHHAASTFSPNILDDAYNCKDIVLDAIKRVGHVFSSFENNNIQFIFYASQSRPNKNILSLLRAYNYLIKNKFIKYKLILTCSRYDIEDVDMYINQNNLNMDVIFCHGLTTQELVAMYKSAILAVNPSLSEGGCPFTFTEAMSVGTPCLMADISVTREVIDDDGFITNCLFDPYDYKDIALKIDWGVRCCDHLYKLQLPIYQRLAKRTWSDVAKEHLDILDAIYEQEMSSGPRTN